MSFRCYAHIPVSGQEYVQLSNCLIETLNKDEVYWLAVLQLHFHSWANSVVTEFFFLRIYSSLKLKPPATHHYSAFQTHTPWMANLNLMFSDLKAGCCANTVEAWLLRFGAACNVKKGRELIRPTCCIVIISSLVNYNNVQFWLSHKSFDGSHVWWVTPN